MSIWPHRIKIERFVGYDEDGLGLYGASEFADALVVRGQKRLKDANGEDVVGSATVYVQGDIVIEQNDRLTVPDGVLPEPVLGRLLDIASYCDLSGVRRVSVVVA